MSSGTITVTNKSDKVVGVGTTFTTDLKAGDVMVMPVGTGSFTLIVKSIESATGLTLMEPFRGPTLSGQSWSAVPYETMLRINAQLSTQTGVAIYGLNMDKQNWQAVFSESGDITITLPDLTIFTGPSWKKIADLLEALDPDHLDTVAAQIHADATQVAADKASAAASATTATQKATAAAGSATTASQKATAAEGSATAAAGSASTASTKAGAAAASATEAANSAASIHPENILHKDQNLDDLADKSAARSHLDVYSKAETDGKDSDLSVRMESINTDLLAKIIATNARVDYAMLDFGTMALSQRKVMANPFGINQPVEVVAEIQRTDLSSLPQPRWGETGWIYANGGYGVKASYMEGEGIVVQCGNVSMGNSSTQTGSPHQITTTANVTNFPVRVHVRKITA